MSNTDFFTLEIGEKSLKIFDGQVVNQQIEVQSLNYVDLPFSLLTDETANISNQVSETIKKTLTGLKINKKKVNLIIPDIFTYSQILSMPILNEKELISAIKYQADQFIPLPIDEINLDLEIIAKNEKEKNQLILVVAASKKLVERIEEIIQLSGLIPNILENQLTAFARFLNKFSFPLLKNTASTKIAFINFGLNSSSIYLFDKKSSLITKIHNFNLGYSLFTKEIRINTSLDTEKINQLLASYQLTNKNPIEVESIISPVINQFVFEIKKIALPEMELFLIGETFRFPSLTEILSKKINLKISFLNPYGVLKSNPQVEHYKNNLSFFVTTFGGQIE
jgi:type IV pilus assembly protein PilM